MERRALFTARRVGHRRAERKGEAVTKDPSVIGYHDADLAGAIADFAPESLVVCTPDGRVSLWNHASERLYGIPAAAAIGQIFHTLVQSRHTFGVPALEQMLIKEGSWAGEIYRSAADGTDLCVEVRWQIRRDGDGEVVAILERARDLSVEEAERCEAAALAHRYRNLFHAMAASFWEIDFSAVRRKVGMLVASGVSDLEAYFAAHPEFVDECIAATMILDVNETTVDMFGAPSREAILRRPMGWEWPVESRRYYAGAVAAAARGEGSYVAELRLGRWDGSLMDTLFTVCWPSGHEARGSVLVGVTDISDRKQIERELRRSEARYRDLFSFMPIALCELDISKRATRLEELRAAGVEDLGAYLSEHPDVTDELAALVTLTDANSEALRLLEADSVDELRGPIARFWSASPSTLARSLAARFSGEVQFSEEAVGMTWKGNPVEVLFSVGFAPELDRKGKSVVALVDIGERTRATRALQLSESRYRDLFRQIPVALWRLEPTGMRDTLGRLKEEGVGDLAAYFDENPDVFIESMEGVTIAEVNAAAVSLSGADDASQLVGRTAADFWSEHPEIFKHALIARFENRSFFHEEGLMSTPFARDLDIAFSISYSPLDDPRAVSVVSTLDIGGRKRAERRLQRLEADLFHAARVSMLGEMTASIAHEVNQPLAAITTYAQAGMRWLDRPQPDLAQLRDLVEPIVEDARRASDIIARIRNMAMNRDPTHAQLDLNEVIEEALLIVRRQAANQSMWLVTRLSPDLPPIPGDRVQLQQVIINLALNAMQAMSHDSARREVTIMTSPNAEDGVDLIVEDTGPGIASEHLDRLFEGFFTTKPQGMGMGLAICRSIIESHGGSIRAENGVAGARFIIRFMPTQD